MALTEADRQKITAYLSKPLDFPQEFKDWIADWYALNTPKLNLQQVFGFQLWSVHSATDIPTQETTSSSSYVDLATVGPTLEHIPNGFYIVMFGANVGTFGIGNSYTVGCSVDGAAPSSENEANGGAGAIGKVSLVDLSQGTGAHTLQLKYKAEGAPPAPFSDRWLHALKVVTES